MAADTTVEFTAGTLEEPLPLPGRYQVNTSRFVVEPTIRMLGWPVLRGRFACTGGHLVLGEDSELAIDLDASSLRTNVPGLARGLTREGGLCATIRFRSTAMTVEDDWTIDVVGRLEVTDAVREIRLSGRLAYADELAVVVWVTGVLPPPRRPSKGGYLARRPLRIELAAEFSR